MRDIEKELTMSEIVKFSEVEDKIIKLRDQNVILDSDVAVLYGVETRDINKSVTNNPNKFPDGYILTTTKEELDDLRCKVSTTNLSKTRTLPKAFTEKGLYMLATILKSERATQTTIAIVETFTQIRELSRTISELSASPEEHVQKQLMQRSGDIISDLLGEDLQTTDTETSIELNFAVLKFKHTIKRKSDKK